VSCRQYLNFATKAQRHKESQRKILSDLNKSNVYKVKKIKHATDLDKISAIMDKAERASINCINWPEYSYKPNVEFSMVYSESNIFIKYWVEEDCYAAIASEDGGPVWKDSCVEFFVSPDNNSNYYNFEFSCIGKCLLAYGSSRHDRVAADKAAFENIFRKSTLGDKPFEEKKEKVKWNIFVAISSKAFFKHDNLKFDKGIIRANLYKCGDGLSKPHYLTWSPIKADKPDYHRPEFFNEIFFV